MNALNKEVLTVHTRCLYHFEYSYVPTLNILIIRLYADNIGLVCCSY
jgi:hypothetical protein